MNRLLAVFRNKYLLVLIFMAIWLTFFDRNNLVERGKTWFELRGLKQDREYYTREIEETRRMKEELFNDQESLERFAREKYFMKKDNEDIFIVVEE